MAMKLLSVSDSRVPGDTEAILGHRRLMREIMIDLGSKRENCVTLSTKLVRHVNLIGLDI